MEFKKLKLHTYYKNIQMFKVILFTTLLVFSFSYTEEENVLVLTDDDFPSVFSEFSHILIQFYAPWCGHCKRLAPVYQEVATELKSQDSIVRLAKVDATVHKKAAGEYGVQGFPTLYFFLNGEKMDYGGSRNKQSMMNWLLKKTRDPVVSIDKQAYEKLQSAEGVSIVYHGDFSTAEGASILNQIALSDNYNTYYYGVDLGKDAGTIELVRSFDASVTYPSLDDGLKNWIGHNERPYVVPFDERTIEGMFGSGKAGVVLFNGADSSVLTDALLQTSKDYAKTDGRPLIFTEIAGSNEHLQNFADYIKISHEKSPVVMINSKEQKKYVFKGEVGKESLLDFIQNFESFESGLTDQVTYEDEATATPTQQEL